MSFHSKLKRQHRVHILQPFPLCCGSLSGITVLRIRDVYPGSWFLPSRIQDPGSKNSNKREGWIKFVVIPFFVATNFTKFEINLFLKCWRQKFGPIFKELKNFLLKKLSRSSLKYGFGIQDQGSGKNLFRITDPGSRGQKRTGSRIRIRNTARSSAFSGSRIQHIFLRA